LKDAWECTQYTRYVIIFKVWMLRDTVINILPVFILRGVYSAPGVEAKVSFRLLPYWTWISLFLLGKISTYLDTRKKKNFINTDPKHFSTT